MKYDNIHEAIFIERPNRFVARIQIEDQEVLAHVKNTGRCKELLIKGCRVFVQKSDNLSRKTPYDLIAVYKDQTLINMDSQAPNKVVSEWISESGYFGVNPLVKPEVKYGKSRIDFYIETQDGRRIFLEVKGVTFEEEGVLKFPDAPTERGIKHIEELVLALNEGYEAYIVFVLQMAHANYFTPNDVTHKAFGDALRKAKAIGIEVLAMTCMVTPETLEYKELVEVRL